MKNQGSAKEVAVWKGITEGLCPVCREGKVFQNGLLSVRFLANHPNCPCCKTRFEPEPGFFWGGMYFNYTFNVAMLAGMALLLYFGFEAENVYIYIFGMITPVLVAIPLTGRLSRMLWLYIFGPFKYKPGICQSRQS